MRFIGWHKPLVPVVNLRFGHHDVRGPTPINATKTAASMWPSICFAEVAVGNMAGPHHTNLSESKPPYPLLKLFGTVGFASPEGSPSFATSPGTVLDGGSPAKAKQEQRINQSVAGTDTSAENDVA